MTGRAPAVGVLVLTALTGLAVVLDPGGPVRPAVVLVFLLVCPGAAVLLGVRLPTVALWTTAVVSASTALDVLVATALFYASWWSPASAWLGLGGLCVDRKSVV